MHVPRPAEHSTNSLGRIAEKFSLISAPARPFRKACPRNHAAFTISLDRIVFEFDPAVID
jgi:hypothetical protein